MTQAGPYLSPSEAAARLGVSAKALRLYEERGLIRPARTAAGWRAYGPDVMVRAGEIARLRALGLNLSEIAGALADPRSRSEALASHAAGLEEHLRETSARLDAVRAMLAGDRWSKADEVTFELPWPWGGERFALPRGASITWITGPLFSGKTRLAQRIAETLPGARFIGLDRLDTPAGQPVTGAAETALDRLCKAGARRSAGLEALLGAIHAERKSALVIDMVEECLDTETQAMLTGYLRGIIGSLKPLFLLTRSSAMLDPASVGSGEMILYCPANHSPPIHVLPMPGSKGYDLVVTCLATPEVRARSAGVIVTRRDAA